MADIRVDCYRGFIVQNVTEKTGKALLIVCACQSRIPNQTSGHLPKWEKSSTPTIQNIIKLLFFLRVIKLFFNNYTWSQLNEWGTWEPWSLSRYSDGLRAGRQGKEIFVHSTASRPAVGPTQPLIQWIPCALSPGVKWPGRGADHSPSTRVKVKNAELYLHSPYISSWPVY
jgi:hypothetical protein